MGSDMVVALNEASANGTTLFGLNHHADASLRQTVQLTPGHLYDGGEISQTPTMALPQARQTFTVLGIQPRGEWGYSHGVNEHKVSIGVTEWHSRLKGGSAPLSGPDLARLALERGHGAHHAVEVLTDLLLRHADTPAHGPNDHIFLIADPKEAFVLETSGKYWALLECGPTRAVTNTAMIRQDWRRLAPGLADYVIEQGWWFDDGSKIDFVGCLAEAGNQSRDAQKRWGRASLALAQQQGAIDLHFLRRMLAEQYWQNRDMLPDAMASSFLVDLHKNDAPTIAWVAFGTPLVGLYFPLCLVGELPGAFADGAVHQRCQEIQRLAQGKDRAKLPSILERMQTKFDQDAEDFLIKAHDYMQHGKPYLIGQIATEMMHQHVGLLETEYRRLFGIQESRPHRIPAAEEAMFFA